MYGEGLRVMGVRGKGLDAIKAGIVQFKDARKTDVKTFESWYCRDFVRGNSRNEERSRIILPQRKL